MSAYQFVEVRRGVSIFVSLATLILIAFIGGLSALVFVSSVWLVSPTLARILRTSPKTGLLLSIFIHFLVVALLCIVVFPWLKNIDSILVNWLFRGEITTGFKIADSQSVSETGRQVSRIAGLLGLSLPGLAVLVSNFKTRKVQRNQLHQPQTLNHFIWTIPLFLVAILKLREPWNLLASVASGDGRNNFLLVVAARSSSLKHFTFIDVGILPNCFAALISAGNGSRGIRDVADLWGLSFAYLIAGGLIALSVASMWTDFENADRKRKWFVLVGALGGLSIATNPALLSFCLNDGFLSLYFAVGITCAGICVVNRLDHQGHQIVVLAAVILLLSLTYVLFVPSIVVMALPFIVSNIRENWSRAQVRYWLAISVIVGGFGVGIFGRSIWTTYIASATLPGAFIPVSPKLLIVLSLSQLALAITSHGQMAKLWLATALLGLATLLQYSVIEIAAGLYFSEQNSYYGTKIIVAASTISIILTAALGLNSLYRRSSGVHVGGTLLTLIFAVSTCAYFVLGSQIRLTSPIPLIENGWGYPSGEEFHQAVDSWHGVPFVFVEYSNSLESAKGTWRAETQSANDRLLNFWSPLFWNADSQSDVELYNWIYGKWNPTDLESMCDLFATRKLAVITRSTSLGERILASCSTVPRIVLMKPSN